MIRKYVSSQQNKRGTKKIVNYILRDEACCLFETDLLHSPTTSKKDLVNRFSSEIDDDVKFHNSNRTIGSTQKVRTYHDIVSFHTNDDMNPQKALQIAKELYEKTHNLSNRKYFMAVHNDTNEMHVHIVWAVRDKNGKTYKQDHDYRVIERECDKLENKHGLIKPKNRIATDMDKLNNHPDLKGKSEAVKKRAAAKAINKKYSEKLPSSNERMLDVRGIPSNKTQMKEALKPYIDKSSSPSDFINQITANGFNVIHNGKTSFSIQLDDQIFKASELNLSYKTLKAKLGEDEEFEKTLSKKHQVKKQIEECSLLSSNTQPDFMSKVHSKSTLMTSFKYEQHNDKVEYFYNTYNSKKAFEYYKDPSKVLFNDTSRKSAKAGLQRLMADTTPPSVITVSGSEKFRRNAWIEAKLMKMEEKGVSFQGYKPTPADLEELKKIQEQYASMNKKVEPKPQPAPEAPTVAVEAPKPVEPIAPPVMPTPVQNASEKPPETTKQVVATNDDLIDELMREFETPNHIPVAEAPTEAIEPPKPDELIASDLYTPMTPEPLAEPENHKIDGDYSTYDTSELCDEMADIVSRIERKHFIGNSSNDIAGHRKWDATHRDYVHSKPANERTQYYLRQELYRVHDEIKDRNPKLANELDSEFKKSMKYNTRFKPEIQIQPDKK